MNIDKVWELLEACDYVIGDFTWTSADYIGEAGIGEAAYVEPGQSHQSRAYPLEAGLRL